MQLILGLMMRLMPAVVNFQAAAVDARDVARAHIIAMTSTQAAGQRLIASTQTMHMKDVAEVILYSHCIFTPKIFHDHLISRVLIFFY